MPRANSSVPRHRRHRKLIKQAKGYFGTRKSNYRTAKDAVQKGLQYAYRDRRNKKRTFRADMFKFRQHDVVFIEQSGNHRHLQRKC